VATVEATEQNFEELVATRDVVLVDFWASWCGTCAVFGPIFAEASDRHPDMGFITVDAEQQPQLAHDFSVESVPTLLVFREQILLYAEPGWLTGTTLDALIDAISSLDMVHVHREIADKADNLGRGASRTGEGEAKMGGRPAPHGATRP
jgi:thioredoxin 1